MRCRLKPTGDFGRIIGRDFRNGISWVLVGAVSAGAYYEAWHCADDVEPLACGEIESRPYVTLQIPVHNHSESGPPQRTFIQAPLGAATTAATSIHRLGITANHERQV